MLTQRRSYRQPTGRLTGVAGIDTPDVLIEFKSEEAIRVLAVLFTQLRDASIPGRGGVVSWRVSQEPGSPLTPLGPHLYDGSCGIALFLAAYHSATGNDEACSLAKRSVAQLRNKVASLSATPEHLRTKALPIGGFVGLGAFLYTFTRLARWLDDKELMESASQVATLITADSIRKDDKYDVVTGCAGTLLALLAFEAAAEQGHEQALELAVLCGKHLLERRVSYKSLPKAWPGREHPPLCGFAHGASGIAYALLMLFSRTGEPEFLEAALEGFTFERQLYDPVLRAWFDLRFNRPHQQSAWCHGGPGIALARVACLSAIDGREAPEIQKDLQEALAITTDLPDLPNDHLCCGNSGQVEILRTVGHALGDSELMSRAHLLAQRRLVPAQESGFRFSLNREGDDVTGFQPSLFLGLAGVGYTLLRLIFPGVFPCVLMLE